MSDMKDLNQQYAKLVREQYEENVIAGKAAVEYMEASTAVYRGVPVACLYMPKLFSESAWDYLNENWWALHTDNDIWAIHDIYKVCLKNGGMR